MESVEYNNFITEKATKNNVVIKTEHLKKAFNKKSVLKDISISINKGENLVVLGKSGSGKSVLIKCLINLIEPDGGKIIIFGKNLEELNTDELNGLRKKIGFLFQSGALYDSMSVRENLAFPLRDSKTLSIEEKNRLIEEALVNVGLQDTIDKMPSELSGGMRKRLGLARTLILKPEIIFYDEPTTGLDPITAKEISHLIMEIQAKYNTTSIIITHDMACAKITADRMIVFKDGLIEVEGTFAELKNTKNPWLHSFFE